MLVFKNSFSPKRFLSHSSLFRTKTFLDLNQIIKDSFASQNNEHKGLFTNYVNKILAFLTTYSSVDIFNGINFDKKSIVSTTYPPSLVNVVYK